MAASGPRNLITDVPGVLVGQAEDRDAITGVTVVLAEQPAVAAVDVRGGAPGSRETELLGPATLVERVDAVVLAGGSAFGLDAAAGAMDWLAEQGRGFAVGAARVPIVPAAILFDLNMPTRRHWTGVPPHRRLGTAAAAAAAREFALGNTGAGLGAKAGSLKGGVGSASLRLADGMIVGAVVAVNCCGSAVRPDCGRFWTAELALPGELPLQPPVPNAPLDLDDLSGCAPFVAGANTTIAAVATDATLDRNACRRLAIMAQDGLSRAVRPAHTPFDGDTVFALATGAAEPASTEALARLGGAAADCVARAIMRAVAAAEPLGGFPSWPERWGRS
ncbi:MAG: P1 family peptidase [Alphaproteobacteria bacterium]|nr:P1 family peptidase [Alphaproteobacteria bacterium]